MTIEVFGGTPGGTLNWDSGTGVVTGTMAARFMAVARGGLADGAVGAGPQFQFSYPITDPLHDPAQFAALVAFAGWKMPRNLARFYPEIDWQDEDDKNLTPEERKNLVY